MERRELGHVYVHVHTTFNIMERVLDKDFGYVTCMAQKLEILHVLYMYMYMRAHNHSN